MNPIDRGAPNSETATIDEKRRTTTPILCMTQTIQLYNNKKTKQQQSCTQQERQAWTRASDAAEFNPIDRGPTKFFSAPDETKQGSNFELT